MKRPWATGRISYVADVNRDVLTSQTRFTFEKTWPTFALANSLELNRRRSAGRGHKPRPHPGAGGPQGRLTASQKNALMLSLLAFTKSSLQLNDISMPYN